MNEIVPDPSDDAINDHIRRKQLGALGASLLTFRKAASDALDNLIIAMVRGNCEIGYHRFKTPNGRPCTIDLGIGEQAAQALKEVVDLLTKPQTENDNEPDTGYSASD